jgi:hypothetical protein
MIPIRRSDLTGGAEILAWSENYAKEAKTLEKVDRHKSNFNARFPRRDTTSRNKLFATNKRIGPN